MQRLALLGTAIFLACAAHAQDCKGNWIKASIAPDGTFTITNGPNGFSKKYSAR